MVVNTKLSKADKTVHLVVVRLLSMSVIFCIGYFRHQTYVLWSHGQTDGHLCCSNTSTCILLQPSCCCRRVCGSSRSSLLLLQRLVGLFVLDQLRLCYVCRMTPVICMYKVHTACKFVMMLQSFLIKCLKTFLRCRDH